MYSSVASRRHNSHLLMDYGFVLQDNPYDCVIVETPKPRDDDTERNLRRVLYRIIRYRYRVMTRHQMIENV